jgi:hypothetical protein
MDEKLSNSFYFIDEKISNYLTLLFINKKNLKIKLNLIIK